jgi:hypothetical protein
MRRSARFHSCPYFWNRRLSLCLQLPTSPAFRFYQNYSIVVAAPVPHRRFVRFEELDRFYVYDVNSSKGLRPALTRSIDVYSDIPRVLDATASSLLQPLRLQATNQIVGTTRHSDFLDFFLCYRVWTVPVIGPSTLTTSRAAPERNEQNDEWPARQRRRLTHDSAIETVQSEDKQKTGDFASSSFLDACSCSCRGDGTHQNCRPRSCYGVATLAESTTGTELPPRV